MAELPYHAQVWKYPPRRLTHHFKTLNILQSKTEIQTFTSAILFMLYFTIQVYVPIENSCTRTGI